MCPTCGSTDKDVFLPIVLPSGVKAVSRIFHAVRATMHCDNPWHEDRIIKKPTKKSGEAAARQSRKFWPSGFTVHYPNG